MVLRVVSVGSEAIAPCRLIANAGEPPLAPQSGDIDRAWPPTDGVCCDGDWDLLFNALFTLETRSSRLCLRFEGRIFDCGAAGAEATGALAEPRW
mmetsp:Transcript_112805/g.313586  ORF Transcript_112805/g.313586 Transcript_112805/m.313586 type:complete len:95 (+) Transcript_112805:49-333(+)